MAARTLDIVGRDSALRKQPQHDRRKSRATRGAMLPAYLLKLTTPQTSGSTSGCTLNTLSRWPKLPLCPNPKEWTPTTLCKPTLWPENYGSVFENCRAWPANIGWPEALASKTWEERHREPVLRNRRAKRAARKGRLASPVGRYDHGHRRHRKPVVHWRGPIGGRGQNGVAETVADNDPGFANSAVIVSPEAASIGFWRDKN